MPVREAYWATDEQEGAYWATRQGSLLGDWREHLLKRPVRGAYWAIGGSISLNDPSR